MTTVSQIVALIGDLKPISPVSTAIIEIANRPGTGVSDVAALIGRDPAIASNLLKRVNSAYFGLRHKVDTLQGAITALGTRQTIKMVLAASMAPHYKGKRCAGYGLVTNELWKAAIISSEIAQSIALQRHHRQPNRIFTAALIRDIGKIILSQFIFDKMQQIHDLAISEDIGYIEAEKQIIGITHPEIGGMVARTWNFPEPIVHIIEHHHDEDLMVADDEETAIVQAADAICSMMGVGTGKDGMRYKVSPDVTENLMPENQVESIITQTLLMKQELLDLIMDKESGSDSVDFISQLPRTFKRDDSPTG